MGSVLQNASALIVLPVNWFAKAAMLAIIGMIFFSPLRNASPATVNINALPTADQPAPALNPAIVASPHPALSTSSATSADRPAMLRDSGGVKHITESGSFSPVSGVARSDSQCYEVPSGSAAPARLSDDYCRSIHFYDRDIHGDKRIRQHVYRETVERKGGETQKTCLSHDHGKRYNPYLRAIADGQGNY